MTTRGVVIAAAVLLFVCVFALPRKILASSQTAQETGSLEIAVRVTPSGGRAEPGLRIPVYLLRKSFADIRKEAEATEPESDQTTFIDTLEVSDGLKAWMKRTKMIQLSGPEFVRKITPDDIFNVPEFLDAYLARNISDVVVGFPKPKYKESEKETNPQKYQRERQEYLDKVRKFLEPNRYTIEGIEVHLTEINAAQLWGRKLAERKQRIARKEMELAQLRYLAAQAETDMNGRVALVNVPAGEYWLSTLYGEAIAGDVRLRWDAPVEVRAGTAARIELNNLNAVAPPPSKT